MCVSKMCVCKMWCVCKKFVSKMLGSFQDLLVKMLAFIGIVMGMFFMGNTVSDPSSVIDALKAFNTTSTPPTYDANQVAHHYKNLAFDVTFLSIAMALAACVVCCVKIIVDAGAQDQEEEQGDHVAAARADADRKLADAAYAAASDVAVAAVQAEADAKRAFREKKADFNDAVKVYKKARSDADKANDAVRSAHADLEEAKTNTADDAVAAQKKVEDAEMAAGQAAEAGWAEDTAAEAEQNLDVITKQLKEAEDDATQKETASREAKKSAEDAKETADAAKPKTGMARFPRWKRLILRALFLFATAVSCYSCILATLSFMELLEYKTGCVRFEGDSQSRHAARIALSILRDMLYVSFVLLHILFALGACCTD